jgi:UDP-sugar transporter A1/2/3
LFELYSPHPPPLHNQLFELFQGRNSLLFSLELSFCSSLVLVFSLVVQQFTSKADTSSADSSTSAAASLSAAFVGFTPYTLIPPLVNACGGVVVGMVIKYAGGVRKGFATTVGILLTGVFDYIWTSKQIKKEIIFALPLVVLSSVIYTR